MWSRSTRVLPIAAALAALAACSALGAVDAGECGSVHNSDPGWQFEGIAFGAFMPVNGACTASQLPVYRLYNNRFAENDSNHRFVVRIHLYNAMIAQGWAGEGVAMCLPQAAQ